MKTKKIFSLLTALVFMVGMMVVPTTALAATVSIDASSAISYVGGEPKITVSGSMSEVGNDVTILALRANENLSQVPGTIDQDTIMFIDQAASQGDGTFSWDFYLRETATSGKHITVFVSGTDADQYVYQTFDLIDEAPTDLAFSKTSYYSNENVEITFTDNEDWRNSINSIIVDSDEDLLAVCTITSGSISIPLAIGEYSSVLIKANGYNDATVIDDITVSNHPAGTASKADYRPDYSYFIEGDSLYAMAVELADSTPTGWLDAVTIDVVNADNDSVGNVNKATGIITLKDAVPNNTTTYTITFDAEGYEDVVSVVFYAKSAIGATTPKAVSYDYAEKPDTTLAEDDENYYVSIPANYTDEITGADVDYTVTVDSVDATSSIADGVLVVQRAAAGSGIIKVVVVSATISKGEDNSVVEVSTMNVNPMEETTPYATAVISIADVTAMTGDEITVEVKATADLAMFGLNLGYDSSYLTYVEDSFVAYDEYIVIDSLSDGVIAVERIDTEPLEIDDEVLFSVKFTVASSITGLFASTGLTIEPWVLDLGEGLEEEYLYHSGGGNFCSDPNLSATLTGGTVDITLLHAVPSITSVTIDGDAIIGQTLTAVPNGAFDNYDLEVKFEYSWTIDSLVVSSENTYKVKAADYGKAITVSVTPFVDATDEVTSNLIGSAKSSVTSSVIADTAATASVEDLAMSSPIAINTEVTVSYTFNPSANGGTDAFVVTWSDSNGGTLSGTINGNKYTPVMADYTNGVVLKVSVLPIGSVDTESGTAVSITADSVVDPGNLKPSVSNVVVSLESDSSNTAVDAAVVGATLKVTYDWEDDDLINDTDTSTIQWYIGTEAISGATSETYSVLLSDYNKTIYAEVTAKSSDATTNEYISEYGDTSLGNMVREGNIIVGYDGTAKASVSDVTLSSTGANVNVPISVTYSFDPSVNGGTDDSEIVWSDVNGATLAGEVSIDGKSYTPSMEDLTNGVIVQVTVTAKGSNDTVSADPVTVATITAVVSDLSITAGNVKLTTSAYGILGARVVTISLDATLIDPANNSVKVGDTTLYYAPERSNSTTAKFVGILRANNETAANVAAAAVIDDTVGSENIYYGKGTNNDEDLYILAADVALALSMYLNGVSGYSDAEILATDVVGSGTILAADVMRILVTLNSSNNNKTGYNILTR